MLITRQTSIVQGPLAYGMRRAAAARLGQSGLQILSVAQLAARLAGGFFRLATAEVLDPEIRGALAEGGFRQLEKVRALPGMTRAVGRTLRKAWHSEFNFLERQGDEPVPGLNAAKDHQIEVALDQAATAVLASWPIEGPVPPHVLWTSTVRLAAQMGFAGLKLQEVTQAGTRSWTEVPFGLDPSAVPTRELPWNPASPVTIPGTRVTIRGSVDRLDLRDTGFAVRVTDYKTGAKPREPQSIIIAGGRELQRVLYALACRQLPALTKSAHRSGRLKAVYSRCEPSDHSNSGLFGRLRRGPV